MSQCTQHYYKWKPQQPTWDITTVHSTNDNIKSWLYYRTSWISAKSNTPYITSSFMSAVFSQSTSTTEHDTSERVECTVCEVKLIHCDTNYPILQEIHTISNE